MRSTPHKRVVDRSPKGRDDRHQAAAAETGLSRVAPGASNATGVKWTTLSSRIFIAPIGKSMKAKQAKLGARESEGYLDAMKRLGLLGCIKGPNDLARNRRKYLRRALRAKYAR